MSVIVNELEILVEAPGGEQDKGAALPSPTEQAKPVPRVLTVHDLDRVRQDMDARAWRLEAD